MSKRTINKFFAFVISLAAVTMVNTGCGIVTPLDRRDPEFREEDSPYTEPKRIGRIESEEIDESSGLAASRCQKDVLWTHNDSGDGPYVYAMTSAGRALGTWRLPNASNIDWEDIAFVRETNGQCFLYIGDIGNNDLKERSSVIYRVREPAVSSESATSTRKNALPTDAADVIEFRYPDGFHDAEALLVHPTSGQIYVMTKLVNGPSGVYRIEPVFGPQSVDVEAKFIGTVSLPAVPNGFVTGADISPDGTRIAISDYLAGYEITFPSEWKDFEDIWKQKPLKFDIGKRDIGESIAYTSDGNSIIASAEKKNPPIYRVDRKLAQNKTGASKYETPVRNSNSWSTTAIR